MYYNAEDLTRNPGFCCGVSSSRPAETKCVSMSCSIASVVCWTLMPRPNMTTHFSSRWNTPSVTWQHAPKYRASTTNLHIAKSTEPCLLSGGVAPCLLTLLLPHICCMCTAILAQPGLHLDYFTQRCCSTCARVQQIRQCCLTTYAHCNTQQNRQYSTASLQLCQLFQQERTVGTDGLAIMGHLD